MAEVITYRHNTMAIQSLDTFLNIRGGYHNGLRDVYFIRAIGELPDMRKVIIDIDHKMDTSVAENKLIYRRISHLPKLSLAEDIDFYARAFDSWKSGNPIRLKSKINNVLLNTVFSKATNEVLLIYKQTQKNCSDTMLRNYAVKLWFWSDYLLTEVFSQWEERLSVKVIAEDVTKVQEYLFFYMITLLGCDVLLINGKADLKAEKNILLLSTSLKLGAFGKTELPEYKAITKSIQKSSHASNNTSTNISTSATNEEKRLRIQRSNSDRQNDRINCMRPASATDSLTTTTEVISGKQREKTFEELAQLATSIVMLAVHNRNGDMVAAGSGIMIGRNGFILTNYHVVKDGRFFSIRIEDDENIYTTDEIIKYNSDLDLAVIRIQKELRPLKIYDSREKLVRGQKVVAIGSPLGLFNSVSDGIISGFRTIGNVQMIQFTAPISHGSSGGALLNMQGEVIGISTAGIDSGQNINLAVDYESIRMFAKGFY